MADFIIDSSLFDLHEEGVDDMITSFGVDCILKFPPVVVGGNADTNPIGDKGSNIAAYGGPILNPNRNPQQGGENTIEEIATYNFRMRVYWDVKSWIKLAIPVNLPAGSVQTIGYMSDVPKILMAKSCVINHNVSPILPLEYKLFGQPIPHGFRMNRYFIAFWEPV